MEPRRSILKKLALLLLIPVLSSGCGGGTVGRSESPLWHMTATADEKRNYFINQCLDFGFQRNTPELAQCVQNQTNQSRRDAGDRMDKAFNNMQLQQRSGPSSATCNTWGRTTNCNFY